MSLLGLLGFGTAMHVAPNLLMKAIKSTHRGHDALTGTFAAGIEMGRQGKKLQSNVQNTLRYGLGPESLVEYDLGHKLGSQLQGLSLGEQKAALRGFQDTIDERVAKLSSEEQGVLRKTPVLNTMLDYARGRGDNGVKDALMKAAVPMSQQPSRLNRVIDAGALGVAGAIDPHLLLQPFISGVRKTVAESSIGRNMIERGLKNGLDGKQPSKVTGTLVDSLISPSILDPVKIGKTLRVNTPIRSDDIERAKRIHRKARTLNSNAPYNPISTNLDSIENIFQDAMGFFKNRER